jgi:hypothetical protein
MGVDVAVGGKGTAVWVAVAGTGVSVDATTGSVVAVAVAGTEVGDGKSDVGEAVGVTITIVVLVGKPAMGDTLAAGVALTGPVGCTARSTAAITVRATTINAPAAMSNRCTGEVLLLPLNDGSDDTG